MQIDRPQFGIWCSCLCSGRYRSRFSRFRWVLGRSFFIIGGMDCSCLRLLFVLLWFFVGFALTAGESIVLVENVMEYLFFRSLNRMNTFLTSGIQTLVKPEKTPKAQRRFLIKNKGNPPTASQTSRTASTAEAARIGTGCQGILVPAARDIRRLQVKRIRPGQGPGMQQTAGHL